MFAQRDHIELYIRIRYSVGYLFDGNLCPANETRIIYEREYEYPTHRGIVDELWQESN
jgi:hypothetical protein